MTKVSLKNVSLYFRKYIYLMIERTALRVFYLLAVILAAFGCAKISSPAGGPRDREAPVIVRSLPENGTVNFRGKEVIISFNEYVVLDKINEKLMVSPPMKNKPRVFVRGKSVRIGIDEELRDSTTYTFYFQDAIRDLNEGNPINNFQFVFSTGPFIDSLSVTGNVSTSPSLDPPENTLVLLYNHLQDSSVRKQLPDYITRVEQNGEFRIDNIHPGIYRIYALKDGDNSKNYNIRNEDFAFLDSTINITPEKNFLPVKRDTVPPEKPAATPAETNAARVKAPVKPPVIGEYQLILFQAEKTASYLTSSSRPSAYKLTYTLSLPPDTFKFRFSIPGITSKSYFIENNKERDTITVWLTDSTVYNRPQLETIIRFPFTDSLGITSLRTDTILMRYIAPRAPRARPARRIPYNVTTGNLTGMIRPDKRIIFSAPTPFGLVDTSRIRFYEIIKDQKYKIPYSIAKDTLNTCRCFVETNLKPGNSYMFIAERSAFTGIYGDASDSTGTRFSVMVPESFGMLTLDLANYQGGTIVQLLDNNEKLRREIFTEGEGKIEFPLLEQGFYRVRAVFDLNGDRKWTTGDFDIHRQPEPVTYYPAEIEIKENWQVNQIWDLGRRNFKDPKLLKIKTTGL